MKFKDYLDTLNQIAQKHPEFLELEVACSDSVEGYYWELRINKNDLHEYLEDSACMMNNETIIDKDECTKDEYKLTHFIIN